MKRTSLMPVALVLTDFSVQAEEIPLTAVPMGIGADVPVADVVKTVRGVRDLGCRGLAHGRVGLDRLAAHHSGASWSLRYAYHPFEEVSSHHNRNK